MSCRAEIVTLSKPSTLSMPIAGILYERAEDATDASHGIDSAKGPYVIAVKEGRAVKRAVRTGISNDQSQEILSGLAAGDEVVVGPYVTLHHLQDGTRVVPKSGPDAVGRLQ